MCRCFFDAGGACMFCAMATKKTCISASLGVEHKYLYSYPGNENKYSVSKPNAAAIHATHGGNEATFDLRLC